MIDRRKSLSSTNTYMREHPDRYQHGDVLIVDKQTGGRGQRGNTWVSNPGKNLTFSLMLRTQNVNAIDAFHISMIVSVAIQRALTALLGATVEVKWPNDIYVHDRKIAGILIENSLEGSRVTHSVVGIGLNVNQHRFPTDIPNPISICRVCGHPVNLDTVLTAVLDSINKSMDRHHRDPQPELLTALYNSVLWRRKGVHEWVDANGQVFKASIRSVEADGTLVLDAEGTIRRFAFKEVQSIL